MEEASTTPASIAAPTLNVKLRVPWVATRLEGTGRQEVLKSKDPDNLAEVLKQVQPDFFAITITIYEYIKISVCIRRPYCLGVENQKEPVKKLRSLCTRPSSSSGHPDQPS